jgi:hypothetical protein
VSIVIGRVREIRHRAESPPLVFFDGGFGTFAVMA